MTLSLTRQQRKAEIDALLCEGLPSLREQWEAFYLLEPSPMFLNDPESYWRIRKELIAEGKPWERG